MGPNPFVGVFYHWLGGLAAASFYIPYRRVRHWAWETYWLAGGVFSWIIAPWLFAWWLVPDLWSILHQARAATLGWAYFWGVVWGVGGLTFGLTMRYLGIALGMAIALGYCAAFGTLMPPLFEGQMRQIIGENSGRVILLGVVVCLTGIAISGLAGRSKEQELTEEQKKSAIREFNFFKGLLVATVSGLLSAAFAYGLAAGKPIAALAKTSLLQHGRLDLWQNLPVLVVVLLGGFTTNFLWCVALNVRNNTAHQYFTRRPRRGFPGRDEETIIETAVAAPGEEMAEARSKAPPDAPQRFPMLSNYVWCAVAGVTWYLQFFFYSMGQTKMGKYDFSSWTLHMASIIIFSTLWGIALQEWKGTSRRTHWLIGFGLAVLILSTVVVGYGNFMKVHGGKPKESLTAAYSG